MSTTTKTAVTASLTFRGQELIGVPVLNPGDWFGKAWLLEIGIGYSSLRLIAEADTLADAIDVLADDATYGHLIRIADEDIADYVDAENPDNGPDCYVSDCGHYCDLADFMAYGEERTDIPVPGIRYFGTYGDVALPTKGIRPTNLGDWYEHVG